MNGQRSIRQQKSPDSVPLGSTFDKNFGFSRFLWNFNKQAAEIPVRFDKNVIKLSPYILEVNLSAAKKTCDYITDIATLSSYSSRIYQICIVISIQ